jgi:hypothetical protein
MLNAAYYQDDLVSFISSNENEVLGILASHHRFDLENEQRNAWQQQIRILKNALNSFLTARIYFEFAIPRLGKRADVVLLMGGVIFVIEFKVGAKTVDRSAIEQVHDYALDLKNFHKGSHLVSIVPIAIATLAKKQSATELIWAKDDVAAPLASTPTGLAEIINIALVERPNLLLDPIEWSNSGYQPTPTIIEAAQALYRDHDVSEISRSDADASNLGRTSGCISEIIERSKLTGSKAICFVTGVPGAGKTLAGLNIATSREGKHSSENAVFLSGNGPLVDVMREALARDQSKREKISKKDAARRVSSFIQNIHHFRDEAPRDPKAPFERVVIFDEAQRAWNKAQASKFMKQKRGYADFDMSEPTFLVSVMDRHEGWCVVVCLIGGGQEINTGEAGLAEWIKVMGSTSRTGKSTFQAVWMIQTTSGMRQQVMHSKPLFLQKKKRCTLAFQCAHSEPNQSPSLSDMSLKIVLNKLARHIKRLLTTIQSDYAVTLNLRANGYEEMPVVVSAMD